MRVVHLSYYYGQDAVSGGAPMAATRLHQALLRHGVESHFVCVRKSEDGVNVHAMPKGELGKRINYVLTRGLWVLFKVLFGKIYMPNLIPLAGFRKTIAQINPDVVHIHFVYQDMVSFNQLQEIGTPIVISLHDFLSVNAVDPQPGSDRRFATGFSANNSSVMERWVFGRKARFIHDTRPLFVSPSIWARAELSNSVIGSDRKTVVIPNLIGPAFKFDINLRSNHDRFILLYGAHNALSDTNKGWEDLIGSFQYVSDEIKPHLKLVVFGVKSPAQTIHGVSCEFVGPINTPEAMHKLHHTADAFAFPSRHETQGMTKIEALLDGLPVIAFNRSACSESIVHKWNGWIAADGDLCDYANGIFYFYQKFASGELNSLFPLISNEALEQFSEENIVAKTIAAYKTAIKS